MATLTLPPLLRGLRGRIGDVIIYERNGQTCVRARAKLSASQPTPAQLAQQQRFRAAASYAASALAEPALRDFYTRMAAGRGSAYAVATRDFLRPPEVTLLDVSRYDGCAGDMILIAAKDDTGVASVQVEIRDKRSKVIESGHARFAGCWIYRTTTQPASGYPLTIVATARDHAGNQAQLAAPWIPPGYATAPEPTHPRLIT